MYSKSCHRQGHELVRGMVGSAQTYFNRNNQIIAVRFELVADNGPNHDVSICNPFSSIFSQMNCVYALKFEEPVL